jgi:phosphate transport system substrate-binding protein
VASSWSAYLYVLPLAERINDTRGPNGAPSAPQIAVLVRDSGSICGNDSHAPDLAYAFAPLDTVSDQPCSRNPRGVVALPVGYEAVALARSPLYGELDLTLREVFLALAKWVPDPRASTVHANPNTTWRQIDAALGPEPIEFMGPPLASAAGRSMIELLMEAGCRTIPWVADLEWTDPDRFAHICRTVRTDGVYVEVSSLAPYRLLSEPNAVGIFGLTGGFADNLKDLAVSKLEGEAPTLQGIDSGQYPGSRALFLYVRRGRIAPHIVLNLLNNELLVRSPDSAFVGPTQAQLRAANATAFVP